MDMTKLFDQGSQAFERGNWGLAVMLWQQLLAMQPDHVDARKLMREAENRKWAQDGKGALAKVLALVKGATSLIGYVIHILGKNYDRAMIDCEKVLAYDPNCMVMLWALANAATKGGHADVAVMTLEYLRDRKPGALKAHRRLGLLYEQQREIAKAIESWENVRKIRINDREAQVKLRDLAAMKTMVDGKYETATQADKDFRESLKDQGEADEREQEQHIIRTDEDLSRAIQRVEGDVQANPDNKRYVLQLGDLYRRAGDIEKARGLYERAQQLDTMDFAIPERLGELTIDEYNRRESELESKLAGDAGNAEIQAALAALKQERFDFSLKEFQRQVTVRPTDAPLRAKLGDLLFSAKRFDEAAPEYQKAAADPRLRRRCRKLLGLCLYNSAKYQLAASQFEQATEGGTAANREIREILYYLAATLEKLGDYDRTELVLRQIFDADMSYKDVQERLDKIMRLKQQSRAAAERETGDTG